jgi:hypothetical protein
VEQLLTYRQAGSEGFFVPKQSRNHHYLPPNDPLTPTVARCVSGSIQSFPVGSRAAAKILVQGGAPPPRGE